jgi:hypothetical protein
MKRRTHVLILDSIENEQNVRRVDQKTKTPCVLRLRHFSMGMDFKSAVRVSTMFDRQVGRYPPNSVPVCPSGNLSAKRPE